eukprot:1158988-Pelagomonas_calceolata.AAC.1
MAGTLPSLLRAPLSAGEKCCTRSQRAHALALAWSGAGGAACGALPACCYCCCCFLFAGTLEEGAGASGL